MWHLETPKKETLNWYQGKYLDDLAQAITDSPLKKAVKALLMPNGCKDILEQLLIAPPQVLYPLNKRLESEIRKLGSYTTSKKKIFKAFDYNGRISSNKEAAYELANKIGTRTCVYCNRVYSFTIEDGNGNAVARPDFDHWLPKDKHPLLSMSFYNLIPSCPICNRSIKLRKDFEYGKHIHPYQSEVERQFRFQYEPQPGARWKLKVANSTPEEEATAKLLKTEDVYTPYANSEVKDILEFAYKNTPEYLVELRDTVMKSFGNSISKEHAYRMVFGIELRASLFLDRPLSKMKRDVLKQLQEALGIQLIEFE